MINAIDAALGIGERAIAVLVYEFSHYIIMHKERAAFESADAAATVLVEKVREAAVAESNRRFDLVALSFTPGHEEELRESRCLLESEQRRLAELQRELQVAGSRLRETGPAWQKKVDLALRAHRAEDLRVLKRRLDRLVIPRRTEDGSDYDSYSDIEEARATKKHKSLSGGAEAVPRAATASASTDTVH